MATVAAADDDRGIQVLVTRALERAGHDVTTCDDGAALVAEVRSQHPDVVVTDNQMPVMTGVEVLRTLHDDPDTADIPVVLATGSLTAADAAGLLHDGDQLVPKPFTSTQLADGVDAALRSKESDHR